LAIFGGASEVPSEWYEFDHDAMSRLIENYANGGFQSEIP